MSDTASNDTASATDSQVAQYVLGLADDALIYAQRLGEWIARAPQIEEDMALGNIGLDLLGQARALLTHVGELDGTGRDEDQYAYFRDERDFRCVHLVQQPRGDFGDEMARLLWFSAYAGQLYARLVDSVDAVVAGVAGKAVKEVAYHLDHASHWVVRLGDGTEQSHERMQAALDRVQPYVDELFTDDEASVMAAQQAIGVLPSELKDTAVQVVTKVIDEATLTLPDDPKQHARGGRSGVHSAAMGFLLAEMQHIARSHPEARTW